MNGGFQGRPQTGRIIGVRRNEAGFGPSGLVILLKTLLSFVSEEIVAGWELPDALAISDQGFHLGSDVEILLAVPAHVEWIDADGIPCNKIGLAFRVVQHE